jgi:putative PIN family toxin of toxin-antitoxin system
MSHRVVLDTNVLVAAAYAPHSASRRIVEACLDGQLAAVASPAIKREYELIIGRAVRVEGYQDQLARLLGRLDLANPAETPRRVPDDPDDDKFLSAAAAGHAGWIITNDRHLLALASDGPARIVSPAAFAALACTRPDPASPPLRQSPSGGRGDPQPE